MSSDLAIFSVHITMDYVVIAAAWMLKISNIPPYEWMVDGGSASCVSLRAW